MVWSRPRYLKDISDGQLLTLACIVVAAVLVWGSVRTPEWPHLTPWQQAVLAPVEQSWEELSHWQRVRLLKAASRYSEMSEHEQRRFGRRLEYWMALSAEQRADARATYRAFANLPDEDRSELRNRWLLDNR